MTPPIKIDYNALKTICLSPIPSFEVYGDVTVTQDGMYIYKDNGSDILAVAHLDSVNDLTHFHKINIAGKDYVFNTQLDDRLGAYIILNLLPKLGVKYDILLTEGEEVGRSTAMYFETEKKYKWMFSFDRQGDDVVMYEYDTKWLRKKLHKSGLKPGHGTFSDICFLNHLNCGGINVGCGYDNEHSQWASMDVTMCTQQIARFAKFYRAMKDTHIRYTPSPTKYSKWGKYSGGYNDRFNWGDYDKWNDDLTIDGTIKGRHSGSQDRCILCTLAPRRPEDSLYIDNAVVCEHCLPYAAQCTVCRGFRYDSTLTDGVCSDCRYGRMEDETTTA